ncbi:MAG: histone deacetylase [Dehalococcoidales bacterium]|nr:histone deacetylase [Dehalococcoidales bacterium]
MKIGILYREEMREYDFGPGHSFRGDRYQVFPQFLRENLPEDDNYRIFKAEPATNEDLRLICQQDYIDFTREYFKAANLGLSYPGQFSQFHSGDNLPIGRPGKLEEAARLIIGQAKLGCDLVQGGKSPKVVSIGGGMHHAKPGYGEGFCVYNDVAFCAKYLQQKYKLERILILDTDAHAGNGTMEYFDADPSVLVIDIHQDPRTLYPGTGFPFQIGSGAGKGFTINIPMPVYAGGEAYRMVFEEIVEPVAREFKPQIIIRNGGSDPHSGDGLTSLGLQVKGFTMISQKVREMAQMCDGKVVDLIGSGYNKKVLPYAWLALICGLAGIDITLEEPEPVPPWLDIDHFPAGIQIVIHDVKSYLKDYWQCLR